MISPRQLRIIGLIILGMAAVFAVIAAAYFATGASEAEEIAESMPDVVLPAATPEAEIELSEDSHIRILVDSTEIDIYSSAETVGQALNEAGIELRNADQVEPPPNAKLDADETIKVTRAFSFTVAVDTDEIQVVTHYTTTANVLSDAGIGLVGKDYAIPPLESTVIPGQTIEIIRVYEEVEIEEIPIPIETIWQGTDSLEIDQRAQLSAGVPGSIQRETVIRFENGEEVSRSASREWMVREPVNEVMGYGTKIVVRTMETNTGPIEYWRVVNMHVTAYTPSSAGKPPEHPGYGITASGLPAGYGVVAIDPKVVPFRSQIYVEGYGIGVAGDTGGGIKGRWIDLGYDDGEIVAWRGFVDVYYLTPVPPPEKINYLLPD